MRFATALVLSQAVPGVSALMSLYLFSLFSALRACYGWIFLRLALECLLMSMSVFSLFCSALPTALVLLGCPGCLLSPFGFLSVFALRFHSAGSFT
jgi:hypothetical protein